MNPFDIFILCIVAFAGFTGFRRGLIVEVFSFLAFFAGLLLALKLTFPVTMHFFADNPYAQVIAIGVFFVLFALLVWGIKFLARAVKKFIDLTFLGILDNILGAVASAIKWIFIVSISIWVFESIDLRLPEGLVEDSMSFSMIRPFGPVIYEFVSALIPFFQDILDTMEPIREEPPVMV